MPRVSLLDFGGQANKGLWLTGPRERTPSTHMRRLTAKNALSERELRTRNGTSLDASIAAAHSVVRFNDVRFQGATTILNRAGVSVLTGLDGTPLTFAIAEPLSGTDAEYLFVAGGGILRKVDTAGTVTQWGISPPSGAITWGDGPGGSEETSDGVTVVAPQEVAAIDMSSTAGWTSDNGISIQTSAPTTTTQNISFDTDDGSEES